MKYRLIDIGRGKFNGVVDVAHEAGLLRAIKRHVMSRDVWIDEGGCVRAGLHDVGRVERVPHIARPSGETT